MVVVSVQEVNSFFPATFYCLVFEGKLMVLLLIDIEASSVYNNQKEFQMA